MLCLSVCLFMYSLHHLYPLLQPMKQCCCQSVSCLRSRYTSGIGQYLPERCIVEEMLKRCPCGVAVWPEWVMSWLCWYWQGRGWWPQLRRQAKYSLISLESNFRDMYDGKGGGGEGGAGNIRFHQSWCMIHCKVKVVLLSGGGMLLYVVFSDSFLQSNVVFVKAFTVLILRVALA